MKRNVFLRLRFSGVFPFTLCAIQIHLLTNLRLERTEMRMLRWILPERQEKEWWHPSHHWSSMHHGQGTRGQAEMVRAYTTERRWLCQTNPRGRRSWTTESRKTEKEMDRRRQVQHGGLVAHGGGHRESCWMEKENPCGWPLTRGIHSLKDRERVYNCSV